MTDVSIHINNINRCSFLFSVSLSNDEVNQKSYSLLMRDIEKLNECNQRSDLLMLQVQVIHIRNSLNFLSLSINDNYPFNCLKHAVTQLHTTLLNTCCSI